MADDVETEETESEVEDSDLKPEDLEEVPEKRPYLMLHSGVRKRHTRALRMQSTMAYRAKFVQRIGGGEIIVRRNRPAPIYQEQFHKFRKEIEEKIAIGILELRTPDGRLVDITTMSSAPVPLPPPLPNMVRAEVMPGTRHIPAMPGGKGPVENVPPPEVLKDKLPEARSSEDKKPSLLQKTEPTPLPGESEDLPPQPPIPEDEIDTQDIPAPVLPGEVPPPPPVEPLPEYPQPSLPTEPAPPVIPPPPLPTPVAAEPDPEKYPEQKYTEQKYTEPKRTESKTEDRGSSKKDKKDKRR